MVLLDKIQAVIASEGGGPMETFVRVSAGENRRVGAVISARAG
jgi:hypothetical protein